MKDSIKKIFGMLLALIIILTNVGGNKAFAQTPDKGSITVNNTMKDKSYGIYRIFDLTYQDKSVSYTINSEWKEFFTNGGGIDYIVNDNTTGNLNPIVVDGSIKYINITETNIKDFAAAATAEISKKSITRVAVQKATGDSVTFNDLPLGYYLIHPEGATEPTGEEFGSIVSLTSTLPDATVNSKGKYPTITKKAKDKSADISKEVEFELNTKVPDTTGYDTYTFDITDTLSKGLDYVNDSLKVKVNNADLTQNFTTTYDAGTRVLKVSFDMKKLQDKVGQAVVITYKAKINKDAVIGNGGNLNKVELEYSNNPKDNTSKEKTPPKEVKVYTGKIKIVKHEKGNDQKLLKDAEFVIYKKDGGANKYYRANDKTALTPGEKVEKVEWVDNIDQATKLTTNAQGEATFEGIEAGTYYLKETKAPAGYNLLTKDTEFTLTDDDTDQQTLKMEAESKIENSTGLELPKTGGTGTKLFALIGGAVILYAAYSLIRGKLRLEER